MALTLSAPIVDIKLIAALSPGTIVAAVTAGDLHVGWQPVHLPPAGTPAEAIFPKLGSVVAVAQGLTVSVTLPPTQHTFTYLLPAYQCMVLTVTGTF